MFIKRFLSLFLLCAFILTACGAGDAPAAGTDIQTWVEYPYEGDILPMGAVTLVVYSSAADGISYIQIKVNGEALPAVPVNPLTTDGSSRLARVDVPFMPPAEGEYLVEAAGVSSGGAVGGFGSTRFCIVTCNSGQTSTPDANATGTPTPAAGPTTTAAPNVTITPTTQVVIPTFIFTSLPPVIIPTATIPVELPPPPPSDTSGPSVNSVSVYWDGCSLFGTADITDDSGVSGAEFWFNLNDTGDSWISMNQSGSTWTSQVGVDTFGAPGSLVYKVHAYDSLGNESWSGELSKNFAYCGD